MAPQHSAFSIQHLAFIERTGGEGPEVDRACVAEALVALNDVPRVSMRDAGSPGNGVAPDGSPLIMRDAGSQQLYSLELRLPQ